MRRLFLYLCWLLFFLWFFLFALPTSISGAPALGIHLLHPDEIEPSLELFGKNQPLVLEGLAIENLPIDDLLRAPNYITIPFPLDDLQKDNAYDKWQKFFDICRQHNIIPLVRLTSTFDLAGGVWRVPTRQDIIDSLTFLNSLKWPQPNKKHLIVFNEVNHHKEWGGESDARLYTNTLRFTANWAHSLGSHFFILPSALDLAAPNGSDTTEAFNYYAQMLEHDSKIFHHIDGWNSHSYPNPAFSSPPLSTGQNSLSGFKHEIAWLEKNIGDRALSLPIYITETGWEENNKTRALLPTYYQTAWEKIWRDEPQLVAITPFLLQGDPGPFSRFSMIDKDKNQTRQYEAYSAIIDQAQADFQTKALTKLLNP